MANFFISKKKKEIDYLRGVLRIDTAVQSQPSMIHVGHMWVLLWDLQITNGWDWTVVFLAKFIDQWTKKVVKRKKFLAKFIDLSWEKKNRIDIVMKRMLYKLQLGNSTKVGLTFAQKFAVCKVGQASKSQYSWDPLAIGAYKRRGSPGNTIQVLIGSSNNPTLGLLVILWVPFGH